MGYYMRFIAADERDVSLSVLEAALKETDSSYLIERDEGADSEGALIYDGDVYGQIEVNRVGEEIFSEEIEELKEFIEENEGTRKSEVLEVLEQAKAIIAIRVLYQGRESEDTLAKIDPLWQWIFINRKGLLQADGEGYYDANGMGIKVE